MKKAAITSVIFVVVSMLGSCQPAQPLAPALATAINTLESSAAPS